MGCVRGGPTEDRQRIAELEKENREVRRANEILRTASAFFAAELDPSTETMTAYIDAHKDRFGVQPICREPQIAPISDCPDHPTLEEAITGCIQTGHLPPRSTHPQVSFRAQGLRDEPLK